MTAKNEFDYDEDPELYDRDDVEGDEDAYDGEAVSFIDFDPTQFELPEEFVEEDEVE